ncbi:hypothetical protein VTK26DRAFT_3538 [Humicola hyalothermophila]
MAEQDAEVEALAQIVRRQKEMGLAISDEVDRQLDMLDRLNEDVDVVGRKLGVAKDRVRRLGGSASTRESTAIAAAQEKAERRQTGGGGVVDAVLVMIVKVVLAGVRGIVVLEWVLSKVSEALVWLVELGMLLVQPPQ